MQMQQQDWETSDISDRDISEFLMQEEIDKYIFNKEELNMIDKKTANKFKDTLKLP